MFDRARCSGAVSFSQKNETRKQGCSEFNAAGSIYVSRGTGATQQEGRTAKVGIPIKDIREYLVSQSVVRDLISPPALTHLFPSQVARCGGATRASAAQAIQQKTEKARKAVAFIAAVFRGRKLEPPVFTSRGKRVTCLLPSPHITKLYTQPKNREYILREVEKLWAPLTEDELEMRLTLTDGERGKIGHSVSTFLGLVSAHESLAAATAAATAATAKAKNAQAASAAAPSFLGGTHYMASPLPQVPAPPRAAGGFAMSIPAGLYYSSAVAASTTTGRNNPFEQTAYY
jgi:hypothetical protein